MLIHFSIETQLGDFQKFKNPPYSYKVLLYYNIYIYINPTNFAWKTVPFFGCTLTHQVCQWDHPDATRAPWGLAMVHWGSWRSGTAIVTSSMPIWKIGKSIHPIAQYANKNGEVSTPDQRVLHCQLKASHPASCGSLLTSIHVSTIIYPILPYMDWSKKLGGSHQGFVLTELYSGDFFLHISGG